MNMQSNSQRFNRSRIGRAGSDQVRYIAVAGTLALVLIMRAMPASAASGSDMGAGIERGLEADTDRWVAWGRAHTEWAEAVAQVSADRYNAMAASAAASGPDM